MDKNPKARLVTVESGQDGQRLDNFIKRFNRKIPKDKLYRAIRKGEIRVNKKRIKPDYRLQAGDEVRLPPYIDSDTQPVKADPNLHKSLESRILFEDNWLIVLNKPSGIAVHGGQGERGGIIEQLKLMYPEHVDLELVHRLDKPTSGCLIVAKRRSMLRAFHEMLREGEVNKTYQCLVKGQWSGGQRKVELALEKSHPDGKSHVVKVKADGKPSKTLFRLLAQYPGYALLEAKLLTGRTHQIRVHASSIGHPLAGDEKYGDFELNKELVKLGLRRLFLQAVKVEFSHPKTNESMRIEAPLDSDLQGVIERLKEPA